MLYKIENFKLFKLPAYAVAQGGSQSYLSYLQVELKRKINSPRLFEL